MKVDFNINYKNLEGVSTDINIAEQLSMLISNNPIKGMSAIKLYDIAIKLYNKTSLELDKEDLVALKRVIEDEFQMATMYKAQLLNIIVDALNEG